MRTTDIIKETSKKVKMLNRASNVAAKFPREDDCSTQFGHTQ